MISTTTEAPPRDDVAALVAWLAEQLGRVDEQLAVVGERMTATTAAGGMPDRAVLVERRDLRDLREHLAGEHEKAAALVARLDAAAAAAEAEVQRAAAEARAARERAAAVKSAHLLADGWPAALATAETVVRAAAETLARHRVDLESAVARAGGEGGVSALHDHLYRAHVAAGDIPRARIWVAAARGPVDVAGALVDTAFSAPPTAPTGPPAQGQATMSQVEIIAAHRAATGLPTFAAEAELARDLDERDARDERVALAGHLRMMDERAG